jgi:hypothetical protein
MFENKQNINQCNNCLNKVRNYFKQINNYLQINKTLNNYNLINESIHQNYDDLEEVMTSGDEDNYDISSSLLFAKDMIIKDN